MAAESVQQHSLEGSDRPIEQPEDDRLRRVPFARALAQAICGSNQASSLVVAVFGQWGSGKSSVKNLALHELRALERAGTRVPLVLEFRPWSFSQHRDLQTAFYEELAAAASRSASGGDKRTLTRHLKQLSGYLRVGARFLDVYRAFIQLVLSAVPVLILISGPRGLVRSIIAVGVLIATQILQSSEAGGNLLDKLAGALDAVASSAPLSLEVVKERVAKSLHNLRRTVLVVMDDLDRLTVDELCTVFQLVKENADFPGVTYLLLCDRDVVEDSLSKIAPRPAGAFIEKIVQVQFDLPMPGRHQVLEALEKDLDELFVRFPSLTREERGRWLQLYRDGLQHFIVTLRDAKRLMSALRFQVALLVRDETPEVNRTDLVALEVLRLKAPRVYGRLRQDKGTLLTDIEGPRPGRDAKTEGVRILDSILDAADQARRQDIEAILLGLFPLLGKLRDLRRQPEDSLHWERDCRVCAPAYFDRYFALSLEDRELSEADIRFVQTHLGDAEALAAHFKMLDKRDLLQEMLARALTRVDEWPLEHAATFTAVLLDLDKIVGTRPLSSSGRDNQMNARRLIYQYLLNEGSPENRAKILREALTSSRGLQIPVMFVAGELDPKARAVSLRGDLVPASELGWLKSVATRRMESAAQDGSLLADPQLANLLFYWEVLSSRERVRAWVEEQSKTRVGAVRLVSAFTQWKGPRDDKRGTTKQAADLYLEEFEQLADIHAVVVSLKGIDLEGCEPEDGRGIVEFRRAVRRREQGKSDMLRRPGDELDEPASET